MVDLRPNDVDHAGLRRRRRAQLEPIRSDVGFEFEVENRVTTEPPSGTRIILCRIAMEALVLFASMPGRTGCRFAMADVNHGWHVQIDDDGNGFDPPDSGSVPGHLG